MLFIIFRRSSVRGGKNSLIYVLAFGVIAGGALSASGQALHVQHPSFDSPTVPPPPTPALPYADGWTTVGAGPVFDPNAPPNANAGVFANRPGEGYITNGDDQAGFVSSFTGNGFSQLLSDTFAPGQTYSLTVAVARSHFAPPTVGDKLTLELYYIDAASTRQVVTSADIVYTGGAELSDSLYTDYSVPTITVAPTDAFANQQIGIAMVATGSGFGFFDVDNVRALPEPASFALALPFVGLLLRRRRK
jgi:hapalindole biogenesis HpiC1 cyclase-like protein